MKSRSIQKHKGPVVGDTSILIVEDDFIVAKVVEKSLLDLGYRIAGMVSTGQDAVTTAEREHPDLILMDINLQGDMDGIAAAAKITSRHMIPVVFLTAFSDQNTFSRALETAPYGYIVKPFQTKTLATTIQVALNKHRLEEQQATRNQWLEGALRSLSEGVITIDTAGRITLITPVAEQMTGWTSDDASGKPLGRVLQFTDPVTQRKGTIATIPVLSDGMITTVPEGTQLLTKDGSTLPISEAIASPVKDDTGTITGAAVVIYPREREPAPVRPAPVPAKQHTSPPSALGQTPAATGAGPRGPVTADDWIDRGNSLIFLRRFEDAILAYDHAIALHPTNYQAWYGKGTALSRTGKQDDALSAFDRALTIYPRNHQVLMAKGVLLKKAGQDADADRCFELARLYSP